MFWKGASGHKKQISEAQALSRGEAVIEATGCVLVSRSALLLGLLHGAGRTATCHPGWLGLSVRATERGAFPAPPTGEWTLRTDWRGQRCGEAGSVTSRSRRGVGGGARQ